MNVYRLYRTNSCVDMFRGTRRFASTWHIAQLIHNYRCCCSKKWPGTLILGRDTQVSSYHYASVRKLPETLCLLVVRPFVRAISWSQEQSTTYWYEKTTSRITYEYVVWKGINDSKEAINALVKFCKHVPCKVNLIEYNPIDDGDFQQAKPDAINNYISNK